jgi:hypothetical protein
MHFKGVISLDERQIFFSAAGEMDAKNEILATGGPSTNNNIQQSNCFCHILPTRDTVQYCTICHWQMDLSMPYLNLEQPDVPSPVGVRGPTRGQGRKPCV